MKQKRFWTATFILAGVVFIGFAISVPHAHDVAQMKTASPAATVVPAVTLHDSFKKGVHTITGSLAAPNVCTLVTANAQLSGTASSTEHILVSISLPQDSGVCLQIPTDVDFSVTISAPAHMPLSATVNGSEASTTTS